MTLKMLGTKLTQLKG